VERRGKRFSQRKTLGSGSTGQSSYKETAERTSLEKNRGTKVKLRGKTGKKATNPGSVEPDSRRDLSGGGKMRPGFLDV